MRRRKNRLVVLILATILLAIATTVSVYYSFILIKVQEIPMDAKVSRRIAFNTNTDALHFGSVYQGGESNRHITIQNKNSFPVRVQIINEGNLSPLVTVKMNDLLLDASSNITVRYVMAPTQSTALGIYNGTSRIVIKRKII
jgi:hypothetical protein